VKRERTSYGDFGKAHHSSGICSADRSGGGIRFQQVNGADVAAFPNNTSRWSSVTVTLGTSRVNTGVQFDGQS
jgi:hypothetical protein